MIWMKWRAGFSSLAVAFRYHPHCFVLFCCFQYLFGIIYQIALLTPFFSSFLCFVVLLASGTRKSSMKTLVSTLFYLTIMGNWISLLPSSFVDASDWFSNNSLKTCHLMCLFHFLVSSDFQVYKVLMLWWLSNFEIGFENDSMKKLILLKVF